MPLSLPRLTPQLSRQLLVSFNLTGTGRTGKPLIWRLGRRGGKRVFEGVGTMATAHPTQVYLIIADISGYTSFMLANRETLAHGQLIISQLLERVIKEARLPLKVSKLEGDAALIFGDAAEVDSASDLQLETRFTAFVEGFKATLDYLIASNLCRCAACENIDKLRLKVFGHYGEALLHNVGPFEELAGVDVILIHRLLKNSQKSDGYILLTDAIAERLSFSEELEFKACRESYGDIGDVPARVHFPSAELRNPVAVSFLRRAAHQLHKSFVMVAMILGLKRFPKLGNVLPS